MPPKPKTFTYTTGVAWTKETQGVASSPAKPDIALSAPPEFRGVEGNWTPENLYVASVESCLMFTFLALARARKLEFVSYRSTAEGLLEPVYGKLVVSKVTVRPTIGIKSEADRQRAGEVVEAMEANCFISNSIESDVVLQPTIVVDGAKAP